MAASHTQAAQTPQALNGAGSAELEARLRYFFGEQARLRELLERARAELDQVNAALLRFQNEYCTTPERDEEYTLCLEKILGFDLREAERAYLAAMNDPNPVGIEDILSELERAGEG